MLPVLLDLGFIKIYTQGVFLMLAFFWGSFLLWKQIALTSYKEEEVFDVLFAALLGGILLGRILHVVLYFDKFGFNLLKFFLINGYPGINEIGAVTGFLLFFYLFSLLKKMDIKKIIDYLVAPMLLAIAVVKIGSFFSGSVVGTQTNFILSLKYAAYDGTRHLTALYESIVFFIGSFIAYRILMQIRREKLYVGFNFLFFIWYFALVKVLFDTIISFRTFILGISFDFVVGGVLLLTVSTYFIYYFRNLIMKHISFKRLLPSKSGKS